MDMTDKELNAKLNAVKTKITNWAKRHRIREQYCFRPWVEWFNDEPGPYSPAMVMSTDGQMLDILSNRSNPELADEFEALMETTEFFFEWYDYSVGYFLPREDDLQTHYQDFVEWQWMCQVFTNDYVDLYEEFYLRIAERPDELLKMTPRQYEQFLDCVFRNNGFRSVLGTGQSDGGVDLRLYHKDSIGEVLTLVQAKRNGKNSPVKPDAVRALAGVMPVENAHRGLLVTTSRFLPTSKKFAARSPNRLELKTSSDVAEWCRVAATKIVKDKSQLVSDAHILSVLREINEEKRIWTVVCSSSGYNCTLIQFALVLRETKHAALLMEIPSRIVEGDYQIGRLMPVLDASVLKHRDKDHVFRATRTQDERGRVRYWGKRNAWYPWDATPQYQNAAD